MPFEEALKQLKEGHRVSRMGWNARGMWVAMQIPDGNSLMTLPYIYIKTASGQKAPWTPCQCDVLAEDWCLAE